MSQHLMLVKCIVCYFCVRRVVFVGIVIYFELYFIFDNFQQHKIEKNKVLKINLFSGARMNYELRQLN